MKTVRLTLPELGLIVGTRALFGAGVALLLSHKLEESQRRAIGWTLACVGAVTTIPLALEAIGHREDDKK